MINFLVPFALGGLAMFMVGSPNGRALTRMGLNLLMNKAAMLEEKVAKKVIDVHPQEVQDDESSEGS